VTWVADAPPSAASKRSISARVELVALAITAAVTVALVGFAVGARLARAGDVDEGVRTGRFVALDAPEHGPLAAALTRVWPAAEAGAIATELQSALSRRPVENVGALAQIQIPAARVRAVRDLISARARLDEAQRSSEQSSDAVGSVPLMRRADVADLKPSLVVRRPADVRRAAAIALVLVLGSFLALHALRRFGGLSGDPLLLPAVQLLCGIGLAAMIGLRDPVRDALILETFAWGVVIGCGVLAIAWRTAVDRLSIQYAPLATAFLLSAMLMIFGGGPAGSDARVNLWGFQPVEPIRLLVIVYLAAFFSRRWQYLRALPGGGSRGLPLVRWLPVPPLEYVVPVTVALTLVAAFFVLQRDLGPALVFGCSFLAMWAVATRRAGLALAGLGVLAFGYWIVVRIGFPATLATRVAMAADPWTNAVAGGDQIAHALWAIASGGIAGAGPGLGDPQYIPAGHTDLVLAAVGEEIGFVGLLAVGLAYTVVCHRTWRIAMRATSEFTFFLALGLMLSLFIQLAIIATGVLGVLPLSGVVTPFLSYGRTSMIVNLAAIGLLLAISERGAAGTPAVTIAGFARPMRAVVGCLAIIGLITLGRAFHAQVWAADEVMTRPALVRLADGTVRFEDNPRLLAAARQLIDRGGITDRNGLPVATSDPEDVRRQQKAYASLGIDAAHACAAGPARCYPFGGLLYHVVGDANTQLDWEATNNSFVEEDFGDRLLGYDDFDTRVTVQLRAGDRVTIRRRDYRELVPLVRYRYYPDHPAVRAIRERPRDVELTIDARLQVRVAQALARGVRAAGRSRGAAAVVDAGTGEVLAAVSYPWPTDPAMRGHVPFAQDARLDRVRYGTYAPGSTFKLLTAAAVLELRPELANSRHMCSLLPGGRVGARLPGVSRPIRDDALDRAAHGHIGLDEALRVSCNAYFAQLGRQLGPDALLQMASRFQVDVARPNSTQRLRPQLEYAAFGQGEVTVRPMRLLGITAAIAAGGKLVEPRWTREPDPPTQAAVSILSADNAARLARDMAGAVTGGTGRSVAGVRPAIAGKTGTAEVDGGPSHAWFTGFAPASGGGRRLAFVVLIEGGGYGGRAAAPVAGEIVTAARDLQLFQSAGS
jgi:cell division protein FtsW (lipid II flippase)